MRISDWSSDVCSSDLRFVGDGTAVDDDEVVLVRREVPHCHALGGIQAAAQGDHLGAAHPRVSRSISPVKTCVAGPDMRMRPPGSQRSEEHTSELQSLMRTSYAVFCLKQKMQDTRHDQPRRVYRRQRAY